MLQESYPSVDPLALDALFEANNYNYSHTVTALNASLGTKPQPPKMQIVSANSRVTREEAQARTPVIFFSGFFLVLSCLFFTVFFRISVLISISISRSVSPNHPNRSRVICEPKLCKSYSCFVFSFPDTY